MVAKLHQFPTSTSSILILALLVELLTPKIYHLFNVVTFPLIVRQGFHGDTICGINHSITVTHTLPNCLPMREKVVGDLGQLQVFCTVFSPIGKH